MRKLGEAIRPQGPRRFGLAGAWLRGFCRDAHGGAMVYIGVMLPVMLGVTGLALDGSLWYAQKRSVQAIADTAAYSLVLEAARSGDAGLARAAAREDAVLAGLDEAAGDRISFNVPPRSGAFAGRSGYFEVIVERPAQVLLAGFFVGGFDTTARAVAGGGQAGPPPCLLASDPSQKDAFKVNNGTVNTSGCDIQINSNDDSALNVARNGTVVADTINVVGNYVSKGTLSTIPNVDMPPVTDPLAGLPTPATSGCDYTDASFSNGSHTLSPGVYCGGIKVSGKAEVTLEPGTYVMSGSSGAGLSVSGQGSVAGEGVTAYFDGDTSLKVTGKGMLDLAAPTGGTYAGVLFYGNPNADPGTEHMVAGNGSAIIDGIMYFPNAIAKINGNGNTTANSSISALMARELRFGGNGTLNFHIAEDAVLPPALQARLTLVE
jgi:hypothetical protein